MNDTNNLSFTIEGLQSCTCYLHHAMHKVQLLLNPSTIDGHGGRCLVKLSELRVIQEGNHDDPEVATTRHRHTE